MTDPASPARPLVERLKERLGARRAEARARELRRGLHSTAQHMAYLSLGADPHVWGVLSGGQLSGRRGGNGSFVLEDTLQTLTWPSESTPATASQAHHILAVLPAARAQAELGDHSTVPGIENLVLTLAEHPDLKPHQRRRLLDHLPARSRPIPDSQDSLERGQPPVTLYVDVKGPEEALSYASTPRIRLADIVVADGLQGKGLGTAALTELCMYADRHGLPIEGTLQPGEGKSEETVAAMSRWYARLGFTQRDREPHQWTRGGTIHRAPRAQNLAAQESCRSASRDLFPPLYSVLGAGAGEAPRRGRS
ncbi:hypothetical protein [Paenarthrobacter sp. YIM B13468]|uniref:hypothetical protein n=1 Tax=Paenarthrobacter sp. YIM B13468 TaxID=3366295 RepID=UPI003672A546